ncbi:hypothetical protein HDU67_005954, partial [Dinochytrium kinnereticum]
MDSHENNPISSKDYYYYTPQGELLGWAYWPARTITETLPNGTMVTISTPEHIEKWEHYNLTVLTYTVDRQGNYIELTYNKTSPKFNYLIELPGVTPANALKAYRSPDGIYLSNPYI